ncbi:MAG: serine/threonine-protein kinase [Acidobacteria bacterium]|nr:serine/threonine-protein kinase [Acidobacteriota bacterium]
MSADPPVAPPAGGRGDSPPPGLEHIRALIAAAGRSAHYEVVSLVGSGGIGAVYKAVDTRLARPVAIKALHGAQLLDTRGAARLRAEALAAASLDHPYICKIYELVDTGSEPLIVMEFVEGETLAAVLARGVPSIEATVRVAIEIAEGLAAAHAHGLVHRDVKPANVVITTHGHVKLLDFGLALADPTAGETRIAPPLSDAFAGTPHYMAPEQAAGRPVTARADLFSFGVVLFECLSGRLPFRGSNAYDYVRRIQSDPPIRLDRIAPAVPADLARLVDACLEKVPADRPASAGEVVAELRRIAGGLSSSGIGGNAETAGAVRRRTHVQRWLWAGALGAMAIALAWIAGRDANPAPVWMHRPFVTTSAEEFESRISPDAQWVSFISSAAGLTELKVRRVDGGDAQRVATSDGTVVSQVWSPDGARIAYVVRQASASRLVVVPAFFGGTPVASVAMAAGSAPFKLLRWIGHIVYVQVSDARGRSLWKVDLDAGTFQPVSAAWRVDGTPEEFDVRPADGRVVFSMAIAGQEDLWTANLDGSSMRRVTNDQFFERHPIWAGRDDTVIYQTNRSGQVDLWETSLSSGRSSPLTSSPTVELPDSTSPDGRLVSFQQTSQAAHLWIVDGAAGRQVTDDALRDSSPSVARDGARVVFQRNPAVTREGNESLDAVLFTGAIQRGQPVAAPRALTDGFAPIVSPDGRRIAYHRMAPDGAHAAVFVLDLSSDQKTQVSSTGRVPGYATFPSDWTEPHVAWAPDGAALFVIDESQGWVVRRYVIGASAPDAPLAQADAQEVFHGLSVSPDGRWLALLVSRRGASFARLIDLEQRASRDVRLEGSGSTFMRGWLADSQGVVVVRSRVVHEDRSADVDVLVVRPPDTADVVLRLAGVFGPTTRLDGAARAIYATVVEAGVHNVVEYPLKGGRGRKMTDNRLAGVTFAGLAPLPDGTLLASRAEQKNDIWLMAMAGR